MPLKWRSTTHNQDRRIGPFTEVQLTNGRVLPVYLKRYVYCLAKTFQSSLGEVPQNRQPPTTQVLM